MPEPRDGWDELALAHACRCKELRETFGDGAPSECQGCAFRRALALLEAEGFVEIDSGDRQAYLDCEVDVRSIRHGVTRVSLAPRWAREVVKCMYDRGETTSSPFCGPLLREASRDVEFRLAVDSMVRLYGPGPVFSVPTTQLERFELRSKLEALAMARNLAPVVPADI